MMMSSTSLPPIPAEPDLDANSFSRLMNLLSLVSDPERAKTHIGEIISARMALSEAKDDAKKIIDSKNAEMVSERADHDAKLRAERTALATNRAAFETECGRAMNEVREKQAEADRLLAQAAADAKAAGEMRADLERRLALIKKAGQ